MIYRVGMIKLEIPETGPAKKARTPRQIVPWRDVAETCRTLDAVCSCISHKKQIKILDGIARAGFWAAVFRNRWPECKLLLNEENKECESVLRANFPSARIFSKDIRKWTPPKSDISLLDFDHFTLRILNQWKNVLIRWSSKSRYFIIADGACFGFKFGTMKHYGITNPQDYYYLLEQTLCRIIDKHITVVSAFVNAATILFEDKKPKKIEFLPPSDLFLFRGGRIYQKKKRREGLLQL